MTTLSQTYRDLNLPLHQIHHNIVPLDFSSLRSVPDSHDWFRNSSLSLSSSSSSSSSSAVHINGDNKVSIPLIDLADPDAPRLIGNACETWGVFQLSNHGLSMDATESVEGAAGRFFDLPMSRKLKALRDPRGVTGYGLPRITPFFSKYMWHEGLTIMGSPMDHASKVWPSNYQPFW